MEEQVAKLVGTVHPSGAVEGSLVDVVKLSGKVVSKGTITASVIAPTLLMLPAYTGPYEIVPEVTEQTFATTDKRMTDDLEVKAIPYHEVSNESGTTIIIGGVNNG